MTRAALAGVRHFEKPHIANDPDTGADTRDLIVRREWNETISFRIVARCSASLLWNVVFRRHPDRQWAASGQPVTTPARDSIHGANITSRSSLKCSGAMFLAF